MYLVKLTKFGITEQFITNRVSKLHERMIEIINEFEIGVIPSEIKTTRSWENRLNKIGLNETYTTQIRNIRIQVSKLEMLSNKHKSRI